MDVETVLRSLNYLKGLVIGLLANSTNRDAASTVMTAVCSAVDVIKAEVDKAEVKKAK